MAQQKMFIFRPEDLVNLLTHYTDGEVPLGAEVKSVGFNPYLTRMIGLELESDEWDSFDVLQIRYDGKKTMSWSKEVSERGIDKPVWQEANETPKRQ